MELGLLAPVAGHAGNAGLARDTGGINVYDGSGWVEAGMLEAVSLEAVQLEIAQTMLPGQHLMQMVGFWTSVRVLYVIRICNVM